MRRKRQSGSGRASLDSMTYSSEGSPSSAASQARRAQTHDVIKRDSEGRSNVIPGIALAWLNDDSGSSDEGAANRVSGCKEQPVGKCKVVVPAMSSLTGKPPSAEQMKMSTTVKVVENAPENTATAAVTRTNDAQVMKNNNVTSLTINVASDRTTTRGKQSPPSPSGMGMGTTAVAQGCEKIGNKQDEGKPTDSVSNPAGDHLEITTTKTAVKATITEEMQLWLTESEEGFDASEGAEEIPPSKRIHVHNEQKDGQRGCQRPGIQKMKEPCLLGDSG